MYTYIYITFITSFSVFETQNMANRNKTVTDGLNNHYLVFTLAECHVYAITKPTKKSDGSGFFLRLQNISSPHIVCALYQYVITGQRSTSGAQPKYYHIKQEKGYPRDI